MADTNSTTAMDSTTTINLSIKSPPRWTNDPEASTNSSTAANKVKFDSILINNSKRGYMFFYLKDPYAPYDSGLKDPYDCDLKDAYNSDQRDVVYIYRPNY
ncbi:hypothetical protein L1887_38412 [Cichorium endivia]|nr:hypothetical protein L1887_38412 [Cichorium endivia]